LSTIIWTDHPHGHRLRIYKAVSAAVAHVKYRNGLSPVEKNHLALVKAADKGIRRAESEHASRVKQARKAVDKAAVPTKIQSLGRVRLTDEHLQTPNGQRPLTPDVQARVDTAGNLAAYAKSRSTLTADQDHDGERMPSLQRARCRDAPHPRHVDVHQDDFGSAVVSYLEGALARRRLADQSQERRAPHEGPQRAEERAVVVDRENPCPGSVIETIA